MFLKSSSVSFLLLFCFISCNVATPAARFRRDASEESLLPKNVEETVQQLTSEIEKSIKHLTQNSQWIYNNVLSIIRTSLQSGFQSIASWSLDLVVRMEFLVMVDGSHMFFPLNGKSEIEKDYKTVATAVSKLMMNLKTMKRTDQVLKNVTRYLLTENVAPHLNELRASPEKMFRTFLHFYFETLDHRMEADEVLRDEYEKRKTEAREAVRRDPKMSEGPVKPWEKSANRYMSEEKTKEFMVDKKTLRQGAANKLFMKQSVKHFSMIFSPVHHRRYLLARAFIQKAHSSNSDSKVNKIYHDALVRTLELPVDEDDDDISNTLFNSIESALESDQMLKAEIQAMMNQIEGKTVYDTDMFQIDFSLL